MKLKRYAVVDIETERIITYYASEDKAKRKAEGFNNIGWIVEVWVIELIIYCESCDKDLAIGDEYLKVDETTRYCDRCYQAELFICYTIDGEQVGDGNDSTVYAKGEFEI